MRVWRHQPDGLLPDTVNSDALAAGERIRAAIANIDLLIDQNITASIGVSIGVSIGWASAISTTIERADGAPYVAERADATTSNSRNCFKTA